MSCSNITQKPIKTIRTCSPSKIEVGKKVTPDLLNKHIVPSVPSPPNQIGRGVRGQGSRFQSRGPFQNNSFLFFLLKKKLLLQNLNFFINHSPARERLELEEVDGNVRDLITRCFSFKSFLCVVKILLLNDISEKIVIRRFQAFFKHRPWGLPGQPAC